MKAEKTTNRLKKISQMGFSLMELMIALTIVGIMAVVGLNVLRNQTDDARRIKAFDQMRQVQNGLAEHYMRYGYYPELGSWEAMISASSPLLLKNFIPVNIPVNDPWGQPYEGKSEKTKFELKCLGRPDKGPELGPIIMNQDRTIGAPGEVQADDGDQRGVPATAEPETAPQ
ncbi:MAG: type II secretion system GspH family protein [Holophagales bacterium]|jgi:prepilin-type N-terminal cleavage/methylation domain-containing protein|nr:type II secretion system GspH family protein [Holophagales bacterium]